MMTGDGDSTMLPCPHCGTELFGEDWKDEWGTYVPTDADGEPEFTFQGQSAEQPIPLIECPECGNDVKV